MGGFFYLAKTPAPDHDALERARETFRRQGFAPPLTFDTEHYVLDCYGKFLARDVNAVTFEGGDFIASAGTFLYRGRIGTEALKRFYEESDPWRALLEARGHFAVLLRKNGKTLLLKDLVGAYDVFLTREGLCATSSFLAAVCAAPSLTINDHEVYEYVFNGTTLGTRTVFAQIRRLDLGEHMALDPAPELLRAGAALVPEERAEPFARSVERNLETLLGYTSELAGLFGDNIRMALSGGYDSRFLLALFRRVGVTPKLFVYGSDTDEDVLAAMRIAATERIALEHVNKARLRPIEPKQYAEVVETNFFREDALPSGGIFVNGAELIAREQRNAGGALHVNGGGGEIYRNFFNLFDRPLSPRHFVWVFYSGYDPSECTKLFDARAYDGAIAAKVTALLRHSNRKLSRRQVEALYPYFRCRAWFGHENSINNRWGYSLLPFYDQSSVPAALGIPVRYKHFGNFESAMLRRADPQLARHLSNYGHSFARNAPLSVVMADLAVYLRPFWVRRLTFRIRNRLVKPEARSALLSNAYLKRVISCEYPYLSRYFHLDKVPDSHMSRICTLEYLFSRIGARRP